MSCETSVRDKSNKNEKKFELSRKSRMRRAFDLSFTTPRGNFHLPVEIEKSFNERVFFKTGYNCQPAKWLKVTVKDPDLEKVTSPDEIEHVIQANELESLAITGEEDEFGRPVYVVIDKSGLKNMFPSTPEMRVLKTVPTACVSFDTIEGHHYFLNVRKQKKGKIRKSNPEDEALYNLIFLGLRGRSEVLLVHYNAMNTNKYAVVYSGVGGLRMSNLIGSNYQKERKEKQAVGTKIRAKLYDRLVQSIRDVKLGEYKDDYGEKLQELADSAIRGEVYVKNKEPKKIPACLARLSALEDNDEDETIS